MMAEGGISSVDDEPPEWTIKDKVVLITGANTGIGRVTALEIAKRGAAKLILACRNLKAAEEVAIDIRKQAGYDEVEGLKRIYVRHLDLSSLASVRRFAAEILATEQILHVLINNAGIAAPLKRQLTEDGFESTFQVNHLGHFLLTNLLLDMIKKSAPARIVIVASDGYHFQRPNGLRLDDLQYDRRIFHPLLAYTQSKLCNILHARRLHQLLNSEKDSGVVVFSLNPGKVDTDIIRHQPKFLQFFMRRIKKIWVPPEVGAKTTLICACDPGIEQYSGRFWHKCKLVKVYSIAEDDVQAQKLWELCEQYCAEQVAKAEKAK